VKILLSIIEVARVLILSTLVSVWYFLIYCQFIIQDYQFHEDFSKLGQAEIVVLQNQ